MKPVAKPFYESALDAMKHARTHLAGDMSFDAAQVILSLDHMVEMLMKAVLLEQGKSIMQKPKRSVSFYEALAMLGERRDSAAVEILRERRDNVQHFATYLDASAVLDLFDAVVPFVEDLAREVLGIDALLAKAGFVGSRVIQEEPSAISSATTVDPSDGTQRDASYEGGALAWAGSGDPTGRLRIRFRKDGKIRWLSPPDSFEYMPRTDGSSVAAYRQSGGVVLYDLEREERTLVTETGGPGDVRDGLIAVQGLGVADGLGGGIALVSNAGGVDLVSEEGDSPVLAGDAVYWQQLVDGSLAIQKRSLSGGNTATVVTNATHHSVHGSLLVFNTWPRDANLRVMHLESGETRDIGSQMTFPNVRGSRIAALQKRGDDYDLVVIEWPDGDEVLRVEGVGFPTGRGPVLTDTSVVWESGREQHHKALLERAIKG